MSMPKTTWTRRAAIQAGVGLAGAVAMAPRRGAAANNWNAVRSTMNDGLGGIGASLLVLTRDQTVFREAFGSTPIQVPVLLASASMAPSALAILALVDQGRIKLDDQLNASIPAFDGDKKAITLRQCLAHTSGIADPGTLLVPPMKDPGVSLEQEVNAAAKKKLTHRPGAVFAFGGMSYQAAGRATEVASGTPWELLFKQLINDPLGAGFTFGETPDPRLAGGASASLDSCGAVLRMILNDGKFNGVRILSKAAIKELRTNQLGAISLASPTADGPGVHGYGLGWRLESVDSSGLATSINAAGAFGTVPWIDFKKGYATILLMRDKESDGTKLAAKIRPLIEAALG